jgi:hypothetical protein
MLESPGRVSTDREQRAVVEGDWIEKAGWCEGLRGWRGGKDAGV